MFFNWYMDRWWFDKSTCTTEAVKLETVIESSIVFDHYPRIEEDRVDEPNIGNIVSGNFYVTFKLLNKCTNSVKY